MEKNKLDYQLFLQQERGFFHQPYNAEKEFYNAVVSGDYEYIQNLRNKFSGRNFSSNESSQKGVLSSDLVRNERYHLIVNAAVIARKCIEHGLSSERAYTMSDLYIRRADKINSILELKKLNDEMVLNFTLVMKDMHARHNISSITSKCICYIEEHLNQKITLEIISKKLNMNKCYIATVFKRDTGTTIHMYILSMKLDVAKKLLLQTSYSCAEISDALGFSSQSHFIVQFKKRFGITPKEFRNHTS